MTLQELSMVCSAKGRVRELHEMLKELRLMATSISVSLIDGMPKAPFQQESKVERIAQRIVDTEMALAEAEIEAVKAECELQRYISTVPDSRLRLILQYRYVDGLSWDDVATKFDYDDTTSSVKHAIYRFLKDNERSPPNQTKSNNQTDEKE